MEIFENPRFGKESYEHWEKENEEYLKRYLYKYIKKNLRMYIGKQSGQAYISLELEGSEIDKKYIPIFYF